jgi:uncharacterized protein (TIGR03067 family)
MNPTPIFALAFVLSTGDITTMIRKDLAALQGTWKVVAAENKGEKVPADELKKLYLIFKGDAVFIREGDKTTEAFSFLLDPSKAPKQIDLTLKVGPQKGRGERGIYHLDGDALKICIQSDKDAARPRDFSSPAGSQISLTVLQRSKE